MLKSIQSSILFSKKNNILNRNSLSFINKYNNNNFYKENGMTFILPRRLISLNVEKKVNHRYDSRSNIRQFKENQQYHCLNLYNKKYYSTENNKDIKNENEKKANESNDKNKKIDGSNDDKKNSNTNNQKSNNVPKFPKNENEEPKKSFILLPYFLMLSIILYNSYRKNENKEEISWQDFREKYLSTGSVKYLEVCERSLVRVHFKPELFEDTSKSFKNILKSKRNLCFSIGSVEVFEKNLEKAQDDLGIPSWRRIPVIYSNEGGSSNRFVELLPTLLFFLGMWWAARNSSGKTPTTMGSQGLFGLSKSNARMYNQETVVKVKFKDIAGMNEAKEEIMEFVKILKNPSDFELLGAKMPKGAILSGPPGTGKTLLAKATAGEAGVPFLSVSGSEFVEMFVGVGSSRVRDLFSNAKKLAPCIIFIDEIDAIGRTRSRMSGIGGGNDERENTLNQLLVEMDGFDSSDHVIVLAGTNRPDVLDPALMRPGRFDRHVTIEKPDIVGRKEIFKVHLKPIIIDPKEDLENLAKKLATLTPGFSGADIHIVCNEAALIAAREQRPFVQEIHFEKAIERVVGGLEKKSKLLNPHEKKIIAYHEAGHAVVGWFLKYASPLLKVSIIPRGTAALGYAQYLPKENYLYSKNQLLDIICMSLGGRCSEQLFFNNVTTGAFDDLQKVTQMAYSIIIQYGMSDTIGNVSFKEEEGSPSFTKPYSEETARMIDSEVRELVKNAYERTSNLLKEKKEEVEKVAKLLLEKEVINRTDLEGILGKRPWKEHINYEDKA